MLLKTPKTPLITHNSKEGKFEINEVLSLRKKSQYEPSTAINMNISIKKNKQRASVELMKGNGIKF